MNLKQLIFPPRCPFCGRIMKREEPCEPCLKAATELTSIVCGSCGADPEHCGCNGRTFAFRRNVSAFLYERSPRNLLLRFKQRKKPQLAEFMSRRMYFHILARLGTDFSVITFVPQTRKKWLQRGFCPAQLLAKNLSERLNIECKSLLRRKGGGEQKYVKGNDRWANAKRNYTLQKNAKTSGRVLLVDDLMTTGATLDACASLLLKAGAEEVYCATFAVTAKKG